MGSNKIALRTKNVTQGETHHKVYVLLCNIRSSSLQRPYRENGDCDNKDDDDDDDDNDNIDKKITLFLSKRMSTPGT